MKDQFVRIGVITPEIRVADVAHNLSALDALLAQAERREVSVCVTPELCLTGYTAGDLLTQDLLLEAVDQAVAELAARSVYSDMVIFLGAPFAYQNRVYSAAVCIQRGKIRAVIPKSYFSNQGGRSEARYFSKGPDKAISLQGGVYDGALFGTRIILESRDFPSLTLAAELGTDLEVPHSPSLDHTLAGANIVVNLAASQALVGGAAYRRDLVRIHSAKLVSAYAYASAGRGESTQEGVYSGHQLICENGHLLGEAFLPGLITADIDLGRIESERRKLPAHWSDVPEAYNRVSFTARLRDLRLDRAYEAHPFVPADPEARRAHCEEVLAIQAEGLRKRLDHTGIRKVILGLSGGLDSTLALLVCLETYKSLGWPAEDILAVTMPGFGTTDRTYDNTLALAQRAGVELREISIAEAVSLHFQDIGLDPDDRGPAFENGQARERTQILMDLANKEKALVIGTGDLSELALGWCTYGGDQISMYGVNASIPKTLVRSLIDTFADHTEDVFLRETLQDILATPVSPELLPAEEGVIVQKTEDLIGPYELHDFTLFYLLRYGYRPRKIFRLAQVAFKGTYDDLTILKWMKVLYRRFFSQRFKTTALPDGVSVGTVSLSPRGRWVMPSDAISALWLQEIGQLEQDERKAYGR